MSGLNDSLLLERALLQISVFTVCWEFLQERRAEGAVVSSRWLAGATPCKLCKSWFEVGASWLISSAS